MATNSENFVKKNWRTKKLLRGRRSWKMHFLTIAACRTAQTGSLSSFLLGSDTQPVYICVHAETCRDRLKNEFLANFRTWHFSIFSHFRPISLLCHIDGRMSATRKHVWSNCLWQWIGLLPVYEIVKYRLDMIREKMVWPKDFGTSVDLVLSKKQKTKSDRISLFQVLCFPYVSGHLESDCIWKFLPKKISFTTGFPLDYFMH